MNIPSEKRGFTLVELLVVIGIIGVLAGTLGMALRDGDRGAALQAAQSSLSSLVSAARSQAALRNANASIIIWGNEDEPDTYLRRAAIMIQYDNNDGNGPFWMQHGDSIDLPNGVFFVPPDAGAYPAKLEPAADWALHAKTGAAPSAPVALAVKRYDPDADPLTWDYSDDPRFTAGRGYRSIALNQYGQLVNNTVNHLVVAAGEQRPGDGVLFNNSDSLCGLAISVYGIPTIVNEKAGLK